MTNPFREKTCSWPTLALTLLGTALGSTTLHANLDIEAEEGGIRLLSRGVPVGDTPVYFRIQEWKTGDAPLLEESAASGEIQGVGSIIKGRELEATVLEPAGPPVVLPDSQTLNRTLNGYHQHLNYANDFIIEATWTAMPGRIDVSGYLENTADTAGSAERAVTLSLHLPLDVEGLYWLQDAHTTLPATTATERIHSVSTTAGARGSMSFYPFGGVSGDGFQLAAGSPMDEPRIQRIRWDHESASLVIEVDVAVSPEPTAFPGRVPFDFVLFSFDHEFGFRGLLQAYYDLFPESFENRWERQGQWMAFTQLDMVRRVEDFHFAFHEYHPDVSVAYNNKNDIWSLVYCEPPVQYIHLGPNDPQSLDFIESLLMRRQDRQASQIRGSGSYNMEEELQVAWVETPWAVGARVPTNGSPAIPRTEENPWNSFDANWAPYIELYRRHAVDRATHWTGGRVVEGIVGAPGRVLELRAGESASQLVEVNGSAVNTGILAIDAMGIPGTTLLVTLHPPDSSDAILEKRIELEHNLLPHRLSLGNVPGEGRHTLTLRTETGEAWVSRVASDVLTIMDPGFQEGQLDPEQVTGLYMDSFEGWDSKDMNFRRDHFPHSRYPLTFHSLSGKVGQVNMMHNFAFAEEARERLHRRNHILMANTALYQWGWSAHYLDVMGIESNWGGGRHFAPPRIADMDFIRALSGQKPYCYLLNAHYDTFRGEFVEWYFARCLHYGFWPGFFSHNAAEDPYWLNPEWYEEDRPLFLRYMRPQAAATEAGWEPVSLVEEHPDGLLVERWGGGPWQGRPLNTRSVRFTVYNPTESLRSGRLTPDRRLLDAALSHAAIDGLTGERMMTSGDHSITVELASHLVALVQYVALEAATLQEELSAATGELAFLFDKYAQYGEHSMDSRSAKSLQTELKDSPAGLINWHGEVRASIDAIYHEEWNRALRLALNLGALLEETEEGRPFTPILPPVAVHNRDLPIDLGDEWRDRAVDLLWETGESSGRLSFDAGKATIPSEVISKGGESLRLSLLPGDPDTLSPRYTSRLPIHPPLTILDFPQRVFLFDELDLSLTLRNNQASTLLPEFVAAPPPTLSISHTLNPDGYGFHEPATMRIAVKAGERERSGEERVTVPLSWRDKDGELLLERELEVVLLPSDASVLRSSDVKVSVDSYYYGYSHAPLTDGIVDPEGLDWVEAAWASDEGLNPHWAEFEFPRPRSLSEVTIHWAWDTGRHHTSQEFRVMVLPSGSDGWVEMATHSPAETDPSSRVEFDRIEVDRLRIVQPAGSGPVDRPGIMWVGEVEAR